MTVAKRYGQRGGARFQTIIPQGDLYHLIARSKLPAAERFECWIFDEVIPSIEEHVGYLHAIPEMSDEEIMAKAHKKVSFRQRKVNSETY